MYINLIRYYGSILVFKLIMILFLKKLVFNLKLKFKVNFECE